MRKPVIAAVIVGFIGFGGLVGSAGLAEAAVVPASVSHPAPTAQIALHKGVKAKPKLKRSIRTIRTIRTIKAMKSVRHGRHHHRR